ncbi:hypothetical protein KSX_62780 [Ktedonospora formicarum]|uniref:Uncharacterized protein n=1 Tax=Ktedonospora formicarum TaxID=2778364 RepID=A0A8J3MUE1_9CHLR|nr:hypothetical protein KSX_62780 [Ktedonospora formicarum]
MSRGAEFMVPDSQGNLVKVTVEGTPSTGYTGKMEGGSLPTIDVEASLEAVGIDPDQVKWKK